MNKIEIHYDFTIGDELSYHEGLLTEGSFSTHVLDFFSRDFISPDRDVVIVRSDGAYISAKEIYEQTYNYSYKNIRPAHDIRKLFLSGHFNWRIPEVLWNQEGYCSSTSMVITDLDQRYQNNLSYNLHRKTINLIEHTIASTLSTRYSSPMFKIPSTIKHQLIDNIQALMPDLDTKIEDDAPLLGRNILLAPCIARHPHGRTGVLLTMTTRTQQPASWSFPIHESGSNISLRYDYELSLLSEADVRTTTIPPILQRILDDGLSYEIFTELHPNKRDSITKLAVFLDGTALFCYTFKEPS